jgi:transcriptional regulator with XRE-family HTH domain
MRTRSDNEQQLTEYVPANIKHLREGRKLTQVELSKQLLAKHPKCGLTSKRISDIEIKRNPIYIQELIAYAAFFDCTIDVLFEKPAAMEYGSLSIDGIRHALHLLEGRVADLEDSTDLEALELAQITLKARVDFIVEAINTLQGTVDAQKELF